MDSSRDSQVVDVAVPEAETQCDSQVADVAVAKAEAKGDSQVADIVVQQAENQHDSQVVDVAVPKAESQADDVAVPVEAEMVILSRLARLDVPANDWNNRMREVSMQVASKLPYVGKAASIILGIFWPTNKDDIFKSLKKDIENLVDQKILAKELEERQSEIHSLRTFIETYETIHIGEKGYWLGQWISEAIKLKDKLQQSSNNIHVILPTITVALLHLSGLRERVDFGREIYGDDDSVRMNDLEKEYRQYVVDYFPDIYKKWKVWRADQVVINRWLQHHPITIPPFYVSESHATVEDKVSGVKQQYYKDWHSSTDIFESITNDHKTRMCNDAYTEMAGFISTTFDFNTIVPSSPEPPYDKALFGTMFLGPYAEDLVQFSNVQGEPRYRRIIDHNDYDVNKGCLEEIVIREWNTIDAMQFNYTNGLGLLAGDPNGGLEHRVDVNNKYVNGLSMGFSNGLLCFVQVLYRDGNKSSQLGNRLGWRTANSVANGPPGYKLRSWSYGVNNGPSNTKGPGTLQLQYEVQL